MNKQLKKKVNIISLVVVIIILILFLMTVLLLVNRQEKEKYKLNEFYEVYPDEIQTLYSYLTDVSCTGAMYFDMELDGDEYLVSDWHITELLNYTFSYIDKYFILSNKIDGDDLKRQMNILFVDLPFNVDDIQNFEYGEYVYNYTEGNLKRKENKCSTDITYVSDLYGYSYSDKLLSVDVNMGYVKDNILYDLSNKALGTYTKDVVELRNMLKNSSYYRYNYINDKGTYKINSVEWVSKI